MNKREIYCQGHYVTVSRRFLNKVTGKMRVRVTIKTTTGKVEHTEYRDFADMHTGDAAYSKQVAHYTAKSLSH